jgi:hypothetical protein
MRQLDGDALDRALESLAIRLGENDTEPVEIVVCGDSALILTGMVSRTTKDVDIVALAASGVLLSPDPLPEDLQRAAAEAAEDMDLSESWLNNGPSRGEGGLFQMGLPKGLVERLHTRRYGPHLTVHFIDRLDQIHFKLYAAVDRGGYHIEDLLALAPNPDEIEAAARWAMTHDVSEGFAGVLRDLLRSLGYADLAVRL